MRKLLPSLLLVLSWPAQADMFGFSESQMYVQLMQIVKTTKEQLEQAKKAYEVTSEIYALSKADSTSLDRILNTELVSMMRDRGWMVDGLNTLQDVADLDRQISYMSTLLAEAKDADTRDQIQYAIDLLKQQRAVLKLSAQADRNLGKAASDLSERESSRITAENTAILARHALAEQDRINRIEAQQKAGAADARRFTRDAAKLYRSMGDR